MIDPRMGFCGEGDEVFCQVYGARYSGRWTSYAGGQLNGVDTTPGVGRTAIKKLACLHLREDMPAWSLASFRKRVIDWAISRAAYRINIFDWTGGKVFDWMRPNVDTLIGHDAGPVIDAVTREKGLPVQDRSIWEIGNEPNLLPNITPQDYAAIYAAYHRLIKSQDTGARSALTAGFNLEMIPQSSRDAMRDLFNDLAVQEWRRRGLPYNWFTRSVAIRPMAKDIANLLSGRIFQYSTIGYFRAVLAALPDDCVPDLLTVHFYPLDVGARLSFDQIEATVTGCLAEMQKAARERFGVDIPIGVTEYGNANPYIDRDLAAMRCEFLTEILRAQPPQRVALYTFFKPVGTDAHIHLLPGVNPPFSRMVDDPNYEAQPGTVKENLNALGREVLRAAGHVEA